MAWFWIALIGPVLYAASNHIDKYLLRKYFKNGEAGAVILFSALFAIVALPFIYLIDSSVFSIGLKPITILLLNGTINIICLIFYFKALVDDEASVVVPYYQTIPVFSFILGYFILGESLLVNQIVACGLIVIGTIIISLDLSESKIRIKSKVAILMLLSSLLFAIGGVVFKFVAVDAGFWPSIFWDFAGKILLGIIILIFIGSYRRQFFQVLESNSFPVISLNSFNEFIFLIADSASSYALMLAPIALVTTINGFQPVFVFIFGIILTLFFPKIEKESLSKNELAQKILAIGIITVGTYMLGTSGAL